MWGNILTDVSVQTNFNVFFQNTKSEILINLTQWQYWWWFWFSFLWALYLLIILKTIRKRIFKFHPLLSTTTRPHGKWGDLFICVIPISWCLNILISSTFIMKLIDSQSEVGLLLVRIRGKQWYWVYKIDFQNSYLYHINKNYALNRTNLKFFASTNLAHKHLSAISHNTAAFNYKKYWSDILYKMHDISTDIYTQKHGSKENCNLYTCIVSDNSAGLSAKTKPGVSDTTTDMYRGNKLKQPFNSYKLLAERSVSATLLSSAFGDGRNYYDNKLYTENAFFVIKQKRYKRRKNIMPYIFNNYKTQDYLKSDRKLVNNLVLNRVGKDMGLSATSAYRTIRKSKSRNDLFSVLTARRLLRTKKVLVLPIHTNITLITNSYDVVHSWFIPGLGLKFDCIPGRATHNTLYIDYAGFYYGQCAEVCGRYHHHMPIRICALPFEHFLLWWNNVGLTKLVSTSPQQKLAVKQAYLKYTW